MLLLCIGVAADNPSSQTVNEAFPGLASTSLMSARLSDLPSGVLLRCGDINITQDNLNSRLNLLPSELQAKVKNDQFYLLEDAAAQSLLNSEAYDWSIKNKVSKKTTDELIGAYLSSRVAGVTVSDADAKRFYVDNKDDIGDTPFSEAEASIKTVLMDDKRQQALAAYIAALSDRYDVEVDKTWAAKQYPVAMDNLVEKARKGGKPLLIDFTSSTCPPCKRLAPILEEVKTEYAGKLDMLVVNIDDEPILGARYGANSVPMQLFYDKTGKETFRHVGFYAKAKIVAKLAEIGVK